MYGVDIGPVPPGQLANVFAVMPLHFASVEWLKQLIERHRIDNSSACLFGRVAHTPCCKLDHCNI